MSIILDAISRALGFEPAPFVTRRRSRTAEQGDAMMFVVLPWHRQWYPRCQHAGFEASRERSDPVGS
jgi:hypothetical protein